MTVRRVATWAVIAVLGAYASLWVVAAVAAATVSPSGCAWFFGTIGGCVR